MRLEVRRRGATRATNPELVDAYDGDASALAEETGLPDRVVRCRVDLAADADAVGRTTSSSCTASCAATQGYRRLLTAAVNHATRALVYSHPPRNPVSRGAAAIENLAFGLRRIPSSTWVHDPDVMAAVATQDRFQARQVYHGRHAASLD